MGALYGTAYGKGEILRRVGTIDQLAAAQPFELAEGNERSCRAVRLRNGTGLDVTVLTDRGMSITDVSYQGIPLAFKTAVGSMHPAFFSDKGLDWLRAWPGGFMTPCGLTYVGSPCNDEDEELGIHGRVTGIPARNVMHGGEWTDAGAYEVHVTGTVRETAVFAENVIMTRRVATRLGDSGFVVEDRFENQGFESVPHMVLQHTNLGFPLIDDGTVLVLPEGETVPRDDDAAAGLDNCLVFDPPEPGFKEQVFYHQPRGDAEGRVTVAVLNRNFDGGAGLGLALTYNRRDYPNLVEWKMMGEGTYVVGIEPSNCRVEGRDKERREGTLQFLEPGEVRTARIGIDVLRGDALDRFGT